MKIYNYILPTSLCTAVDELERSMSELILFSISSLSRRAWMTL